MFPSPQSWLRQHSRNSQQPPLAEAGTSAGAAPSAPDARPSSRRLKSGWADNEGARQYMREVCQDIIDHLTLDDYRKGVVQHIDGVLSESYVRGFDGYAHQLERARQLTRDGGSKKAAEQLTSLVLWYKLRVDGADGPPLFEAETALSTYVSSTARAAPLDHISREPELQRRPVIDEGHFRRRVEAWVGKSGSLGTSRTWGYPIAPGDTSGYTNPNPQYSRTSTE